MQLFFILMLLVSSLIAPTDLAVELDGDNAILTWTDTNDFEEGHWIYRDNARYKLLGPDVTSFVDDISDNKRHTYRITAFAGDEESELSLEVNIRSEGASMRLLYIGIPVLILIIAGALYLGRERKDAQPPTEEELDPPILFTDRLRKL